MKWTTHKAIAITTWSLLGMFNLTFNAILGFLIIVFTSTLPDWDIKIGLKHRGFTHSLLCLGILELIAWVLYIPLIIPILIGYGSHLIADSFTRYGVPFFYPYKKTYGLKLISTNSEWEWFICLVCIGYIYYEVIK